MFGKGIRLFKLFGFEVRIDASWLLLAILIILSLSTGHFPVQYENLSTWQYAVMGVLGAVGLFASIIFHELWHSLIARRHGIPMKGISLFIFGGVAHMEDESTEPKAELLMAVAGPIASVVLGVVFYGIYRGGAFLGWPQLVTGVLQYLAWINVILACFNLLPAFPLDGGRILRAALWGWKDDLKWATRISSTIGSGFGVALIILGILALLAGSFIGGLWWCLIGMFLRGISHASYRQVVVKGALRGEKVRRFMREDPVTVAPDVTLDTLVNDYVYEYHFKMFPVVDDEGRLHGCVTTRNIKEVDRDKWPSTTVDHVAKGCDEGNTVTPDTDASDALATMNKSQNSRLMVVEGDELRGVISLKDMLEFLALKLDLEDEDSERDFIRKALAEK